MKKLILGISLFSIVLLAVLSTNVFADDRPNHGREDNDNNHNSGNFNPNKELSKSKCGDNLGNPVINVTQKVQNDADSGQSGNYWAFDYYKRHITVWQTIAPTPEIDGTYCAIVTYDGNFYAVPGQIGPGGTSELINTPTNAPVNGDMSGGRRATITGTLRTTPVVGWPNFGTVTPVSNYQCDISGNCPGFIAIFGTGSWANQYFNSGVTNVDQWWGWKYDGGSHGTWINAISGNSGNIL